ncbi:MAG: ribbon-helix-helix domain-containing protein [Pyrinomonadaceae bacterium]
MKVKTSITLSEDVVEAVDELAGEVGNRSEFIETALRSYIARIKRAEQNSRDLEIINRRHVRLNREAEDVLAFQGE